MNTDKDIEKFLVSLAEIFPGVVSPAKGRIYFEILKIELKNCDLSKLLIKLAQSYKYFPSIVEIREAMGIINETRRGKATAFVDQMIALLQGRENVWDVAGRDNYNFWKKEIGVFRADLAQIKPQFHRNEWIDRIERAYVKYDIEQLETLEAKKETPMIEGEV